MTICLECGELEANPQTVLCPDCTERENLREYNDSQDASDYD